MLDGAVFQQPVTAERPWAGADTAQLTLHDIGLSVGWFSRTIKGTGYRYAEIIRGHRGRARHAA